jgi:hypothetical protein
MIVNGKQKLESQPSEMTRQFAIPDLLFLTSVVACTLSALTGSFIGLVLSLAFFSYWTLRTFRITLLLRISFGALAGYCVAHTLFAGSFPFGPSPAVQNLCIIMGTMTTFIVYRNVPDRGSSRH